MVTWHYRITEVCLRTNEKNFPRESLSIVPWSAPWGPAHPLLCLSLHHLTHTHTQTHTHTHATTCTWHPASFTLSGSEAISLCTLQLKSKREGARKREIHLLLYDAHILATFPTPEICGIHMYAECVKIVELRAMTGMELINKRNHTIPL